MKFRIAVALAAFALFGSALLVVGAPPAVGIIEGKITYTGTPPKMKVIDMSKEPGCQKEQLARTDPTRYQTVVTGPGDTLQWVVVYVSAGEKGPSAPSQKVVYDQKGCEYIPHVAVMQVDQPLEIVNSDNWAHNIHPMPKVNSEWNKSQPPGTPPIVAKWDKPEFIPVKCNIHPWMHGYFIVLTTSHYAVSGPDGKWEIKGLPPGKYTITAWQEDEGAQSQDVTVAANETKTVNFVYKVLPY